WMTEAARLGRRGGGWGSGRGRWWLLWWAGEGCPRGSTPGGCGCRRGAWSPSGGVWWRGRGRRWPRRRERSWRCCSPPTRRSGPSRRPGTAPTPTTSPTGSGGRAGFRPRAAAPGGRGCCAADLKRVRTSYFFRWRPGMAFMIALLLVVGVAVFLEIKVTGTVAELDDAYREMRGGVLDGRDELGTYELAYLAGGPMRVVNTGLAALVSEGRLRLSRGATLHRVDGAGRPRDKGGRELRHTVGRHGGQRSVAEVRREVSPGPEVEAVRRRLVEMGLLAGDDGLTRVRRRLGDLLRWSRLAWGSAAVAAPAIVPVAGRVSAEAALALCGGA